MKPTKAETMLASVIDALPIEGRWYYDSITVTISDDSPMVVTVVPPKGAAPLVFREGLQGDFVPMTADSLRSSESQKPVADNVDWECPKCGKWHSGYVLKCHFGCGPKPSVEVAKTHAAGPYTVAGPVPGIQ